MRTRHQYNVTVMELAQMLDASPEEAFEWARLHGLYGPTMTRAQAEHLVWLGEDVMIAYEDATWD